MMSTMMQRRCLAAPATAAAPPPTQRQRRQRRAAAVVAAAASCCPSLRHHQQQQQQQQQRRRGAAVVAAAAKKGGGGGEKKGKGGGQKKGAGGALAALLKKKEEAEAAAAAAGSEQQEQPGGDGDALATPEQYADPEVVMQLLMITTAYKKSYDEFLIETGFDRLAEAVFRAPFALLAHNKFEEGVADPAFTYANRAALRLFEGSWPELVGLPSRLSAEADAQQERNSLLEQAASGGAIKNYEGWRRSLKGKRFKLRGVRLFNVPELDGTPWGQAAVFSSYELEDGTVVAVEGDAAPPPSLVDLPPPSADEVAAAEAAVAEQAAAVRALKEGEGLTNADERVKAAVAELQARKEAAGDVRRRYDAWAAALETIDSLDDGDGGGVQEGGGGGGEQR